MLKQNGVCIKKLKKVHDQKHPRRPKKKDSNLSDKLIKTESIF